MDISRIPNNCSSANSYQNSSLTDNEVPQNTSNKPFFSILKERTIEGLENDQEFAYLLITQNGNIGDNFDSLEAAENALKDPNNTFVTGSGTQNNSFAGRLFNLKV